MKIARLSGVHNETVGGILAIMSLFWLLAILLLLVGFGVLVVTFVWIARLLAQRAAQAEAVAHDEDSADTLDEAQAADEAAAVAEAEAEAAAKEEEERRTGTGVNATLGLILSLLACVSFWLSPLTLVLSLAGLWFSANAFYYGFRWFGVFIGRAVLGVVAGLVSVVLQFAYQTGQFTLPF